MPDVLKFDNLLEMLPAGNMLGVNQSEAFGVSTPPPIFVQPTFGVVDDADSATITLISARGATGKTTLAEQLSAIKKVPLWSLQKGPGVSADALRGRLIDYGNPGDPMKEFLATESAFVVIDSLDEAKMRVSGTSWNEFLASLAAVSSHAQKLVLLGRERVLEDAWVALSDAGISSRWLELSYFDSDQRTRYIDLRVASRAVDSAPYIKARDVVVSALAGTVDPANAEAFVGYAPVLDAVVALLRDGHLHVIYNEFSSRASDLRRLRVLTDILERLMGREKEKVRPLLDQLGIPAEDAYSAEEQIDWLVHELWGGPAPSLEWCPVESRELYIEHVREFLGVHCFRSEMAWASPVFSAYVAAERFEHQILRGPLQGVAESTGLLFEFSQQSRPGCSLMSGSSRRCIHR